MPNIELLNIDCMLYMKGLPDKSFDLAIVDPPYGIDIEQRVFKDGKKWDSHTPDKSFFEELLRVSKNQIIWGGNLNLLIGFLCGLAIGMAISTFKTKAQ